MLVLKHFGGGVFKNNLRNKNTICTGNIVRRRLLVNPYVDEICKNGKEKKKRYPEIGDRPKKVLSNPPEALRIF